MTAEKLAEAIRLLQEAQDDAGLGTSMMIEQEIEDVRAIQTRLEEITDGNTSNNGK